MSTNANSKWQKKYNYFRFNTIWLVLALALSASIQFSFISKASIWHDEGYSLLLAPQPISEILERTARDVHPPLYYVGLHVWMKTFGAGELAVRSLSVVAILGTIAIMFYLIKRLFGNWPARVSALFMAIAPFLIRYGQEARMYALVAFLLTAATYFLVYALNDNRRRYLYLYSIFMAAAFYTHYYAVFMLIAHWLYVAIRTGIYRDRKIKVLQANWLKAIPNARWYTANILIFALFLPWLPAAYGQFTRVQGGFWIPPVDITTLPATFAQYLHFTSLSTVAVGFRLSMFLGIFGLAAVGILKDKLHRNGLFLLTAWALTGPVLVFIISAISRPVYIDRYFVFSAVAFYPLLAALLYTKPLNIIKQIRPLVIALILAVQFFGIRNVYLQSNHQMREIGNIVNSRYRSGDEIIAGELYVYLDFSYYNHTDTLLKLYAPGGISGYGETSLLYDKPQLVVSDYSQAATATGYVWIIGKTGDKDYYDQIPASWVLIESYQAKESAAKRYFIGNSTQTLSQR